MGTKLRISNLPPGTSASDLEHMFTVVGDVRSSSIENSESTGLSSGIGLVEMSSEQQAIDCIQYFNGQVKDGHVLAVRSSMPHVRIEVPRLRSKQARLASLGKVRKT